MINDQSTKSLTVNLSILLLLLIAGMGCSDQHSRTSSDSSDDNLTVRFVRPPDDAKPWIYWYWINNHVSREGITRDLQSLANLGVGAVFLGNIYLDNVPVDGDVAMLSDEWRELTEFAIREGDRIGIDIGLFNSPGWSQSGGPWNDESNSMRYLKTFETDVSGGKNIRMQLKTADAYFEDICLLAFPSKSNTIKNANIGITSNRPLADLQHLIDNDTSTIVTFSSSNTVEINLDAQTIQNVRSLMITPSRSSFEMDVKFSAKENGRWKEVRSFRFDRRNAMDQLGFEDYPPVIVSFPKVEASVFRLTFENIKPARQNEFIGLSEITLSSLPQVEYFIEKQLAKMHQTPLPLDDAYRWPIQPEPDLKALCLPVDDIVDITDKLREDGLLEWQAPEGLWTILRVGMTTTGIKNAPASPEAKGLEIDKLNKDALQQHFDGFIGKILGSMPAEERRAFKYVVADSYETGSQNWTDGFDLSFRESFGYDPVPFLPVLTGRVVNSIDESNRFLWDLRRLVADRVAYEYVGGLRELCNKHGLKLWLENYGHWGFPSEFLMYGGQSDMVGGEFWAEGDLGSIEVRAAASAAHTYRKRKVSAESYTAGGSPFLRHPGTFKKRGDWSFTEGVNHVVLSVYNHQPYDSMPGINAWFGSELNRSNTWFDHAKSWIDYQRRCQVMLQEGLYVADIAYFIGEDAPKMTGVTNPPVPKGYSFDYINAEVIKEKLEVKDGKLVLPDGMSYKILILPDQETMRPELLESIKALVADGAVIMGSRPNRSPSLRNYPNDDKRVKSIAQELWGSRPGTQTNNNGKGKILPYSDVGEALKSLGYGPDFYVPGDLPLRWIHRSLAHGDIFFLSNQSDDKITFNGSFRVADKRPELWDALTGKIRPLPVFTQSDGYTVVPLQLEPAGSAFIVFNDEENGNPTPPARTQNFRTFHEHQKIEGAWEVQFENAYLGINKTIRMNDLMDWTGLKDDELKHFSGTATYRNHFALENHNLSEKIYLDIGKANVIANVKVNGKYVGGLWTSPWRIDVTSYVQSGKNTIEIAVTNLWVNQLIADSDRTEPDKKTWTLMESPYTKESPLQPSGLVGPVRLMTTQSY